VFETQPVKFAAMEGQFTTETYAPLRIGGWPDVEAGETRYAIEIPGGLSYLATRDPAAEVPGLDRVPREDWPHVEITHAAFQIMVATGMAMVAISIGFWITYWRHRETLLERRWLLRAVALGMPLGFIGLEAGWFVTEVGRQPWVIQGVMRTADAVTPAAGVPAMFVVFTLLYAVLGVTVVVLLRRLALAKS
jgi:cytochrome d ubiquinol oxidase subunit I